MTTLPQGYPDTGATGAVCATTNNEIVSRNLAGQQYLVPVITAARPLPPSTEWCPGKGCAW